MASRADYAGENKERYKIVSGGSHQVSGEIMYGWITGEGDGTTCYEGGREVKVAKGGSLEILGENLQVNTRSDNPINPAKLIRAEKGDIVIQSTNGKIILLGTQVEIRATGTKSDKTGSIYMNANVSVQVDAPDVKISSTKCAIAAAYSLNLVGKNYVDTISSFTSVTSNSEFSIANTSIFSQIAKLQKQISNIIN